VAIGADIEQAFPVRNQFRAMAFPAAATDKM
jgi:hypothetical protein